MAGRGLVEQYDLSLLESFGGRDASQEPPIELFYELRRRPVVDAPQRRHDRRRPGVEEGPSQADDLVTITPFAESCLACGEDHEADPGEVEVAEYLVDRKVAVAPLVSRQHDMAEQRVAGLVDPMRRDVKKVDLARQIEDPARARRGSEQRGRTEEVSYRLRLFRSGRWIEPSAAVRRGAKNHRPPADGVLFVAQQAERAGAWSIGESEVLDQVAAGYRVAERCKGNVVQLGVRKDQQPAVPEVREKGCNELLIEQLGLGHDRAAPANAHRAARIAARRRCEADGGA